MAKKKKIPGVDPAFLEKQKASLIRRHRLVICLNDKEMEALDAYSSRFGIRSKAALFREAAMEKVLSELEENHPTLF